MTPHTLTSLFENEFSARHGVCSKVNLYVHTKWCEVTKHMWYVSQPSRNAEFLHHIYFDTSLIPICVAAKRQDLICLINKHMGSPGLS